MNDPHLGTILIVCNDEDYSSNLIEKLHDAGARVVGPVPRANLALALAAQTSPDIAIMAHPLTGRRDAEELARELHDIWGVRSLVLDTAAPAIGVQPWLPEPETLDRLIDTLAQAEAARLQ